MTFSLHVAASFSVVAMLFSAVHYALWSYEHWRLLNEVSNGDCDLSEPETQRDLQLIKRKQRQWLIATAWPGLLALSVAVLLKTQ